jgi:hypothetical protein
MDICSKCAATPHGKAMIRDNNLTPADIHPHFGSLLDWLIVYTLNDELSSEYDNSSIMVNANPNSKMFGRCCLNFGDDEYYYWTVKHSLQDVLNKVEQRYQEYKQLPDERKQQTCLDPIVRYAVLDCNIPLVYRVDFF